MLGTGGIYTITDTTDNRVYIGSTTNFQHRWSQHRSKARRGLHWNIHFQRAWIKHGEDAFCFEAIEKVGDPSLLIIREQIWLDQFRMWGPIFNQATAIKDYGRGRRLSVEHRAHISTGLMGRVQSGATRAKMKETALKARAQARKLGTAQGGYYPAFINRDTGEVIPAGVGLRKMCRERGLKRRGMRSLMSENENATKDGGWQMARIEVKDGDEVVVSIRGRTQIVFIAEVAEPEQATPYIDIIDEMPVNPRPTAPDAWWQRTPEQITGITIHHTLSHDPRATARYCTDTKGRPSIQYHVWVAQDGKVYLCAPLAWGMWHDHCGHRNQNVSVGMAGRLHERKPTQAQLEATARIVAWLMDQYSIELSAVKGHRDYFATICPGWDHAGWRDDFYTALDEELAR